ncbi:MAG: hypothetical protein M1822_004606 [Bathelium mastoideum]|nr:MAG: hypothetical protein M1822_004606 [Bathelium mastoideum]
MGLSEEGGQEPVSERFEEFTRRLPDDCIEYAIYIINDKLHSVEQRSLLQKVKDAAQQLKKKHAKDYIWQGEEFSLDLIHDEGKWILQGRTNFGDCTADEWLITWMLRELSKQFEDAWIRVHDSQGEFLFIEAAKVLPKWLNPEIGDNRAWIHNGQLIIIPSQPNKPPEPLTTTEALALIASPSFQLIHSRSVEAGAFRRLSNYPQEIEHNNHHAITTIPRKLAHLLHQNPTYISPAVEAFYLRDPISLKHLQTPKFSTLRFPPRDLVTVSVRFTKFLYAQIQSQEFAAPAVWATAIPGILAAAGKQKTEWGQQNAKALARAELGMKVTCGFEMLLHDSQFKGRTKVQEIQVLLEDVESGEEQLPTDAEIGRWERKEDDDSWMNLDFNEFQKELEGEQGKEWGDKEAQKNLRSIVDRFKHFMNDEEAGIEGAEDMDFDDDDDDSDDDNEGKDTSLESEEFQKKMEEFMKMPAQERPKAIARNMEKMMQELDEDDLIEQDDDDAQEMRNIMKSMENELKKAGALNLDAQASDPNQISEPKRRRNGRSSRIRDLEKANSEEEDESENEESEDEAEENDIDYNLAKNIMEAFKAQGGMAGPAGNMLAQMGIQFPRDEEEDSD